MAREVIIHINRDTCHRVNFLWIEPPDTADYILRRREEECQCPASPRRTPLGAADDDRRLYTLLAAGCDIRSLPPRKRHAKRPVPSTAYFVLRTPRLRRC